MRVRAHSIPITASMLANSNAFCEVPAILIARYYCYAQMCDEDEMLLKRVGLQCPVSCQVLTAICMYDVERDSPDVRAAVRAAEPPRVTPPQAGQAALCCTPSVPAVAGPAHAHVTIKALFAKARTYLLN